MARLRRQSNAVVLEARSHKQHRVRDRSRVLDVYVIAMSKKVSPVRSPSDQGRRLAAESYKDAVTYTTVVVATGYAAFFTVWAFTRQYLTPSAEIWSALLMLVSVASFVFWEVYQVVRNAADFRTLARRMDASHSTLNVLVLQWSQQKVQRDVKAMRFWWISVVLAICPALAAFGILIYSFLRSLITGVS